MALQFIVQSSDNAAVSATLGSLLNLIEVFSISGALWGISVPTKVVDSVGESRIRKLLSSFNVYDLYSGEWRYV